jgi:hypothetical protein
MAEGTMNKEQRRRELRAMMREIRAEFEGKYEEQINGLLGLSREEIDAVTPDGTDLEIYAQLIEVVKDASRRNLAQAELKARIKELGDVAIKIAKKTSAFAALLA